MRIATSQIHADLAMRLYNKIIYSHLFLLDIYIIYHQVNVSRTGFVQNITRTTSRTGVEQA